MARLRTRAIEAVLPGEDESPYTLRVVSDILESNGSSSMATVCGASLALMQAGIPLSGSVAGVAMGLVKEGDNYAILTDIAGAEDHYGDMDFKVAGTRKGITALQMDIKIMGITPQIMREALEQARHGRLFLLDTMDGVIASASAEKSQFAPRIHTIQIPTDKIRDLIGPGGKVIRGIIDATGVKIDVDDTGRVNVASSDADGLARAIQMISDLTAVPEIGKTYLGKVVRLAEFGAFVEIFPGTDGLLHVSEIAEHRVKEVKDELREGDQILVKVLAIEGNRIKLQGRQFCGSSVRSLVCRSLARLAQTADGLKRAHLRLARSSRPMMSMRMARTSMMMERKHRMNQTSTGQMAFLRLRLLPAAVRARMVLVARGVLVVDAVVADAGRVRAQVVRKAAAIARGRSTLTGEAAHMRGFSVSSRRKALGARCCVAWQRLLVASLICFGLPAFGQGLAPQKIAEGVWFLVGDAAKGIAIPRSLR